MALFLDIGVDDALHIEGGMVLTLERKSGQRARLRIEGPANVEMVHGGRDKIDQPPEFKRGDRNGRQQ